jgi:hypothetical protein
MINNDEKTRTWNETVSSVQLEKAKTIQSEQPSFQIAPPDWSLTTAPNCSPGGVHNTSQYSST